MAPFISCRICTPEMAQNADDLTALAGLVESGKVSPVIERTYPLAELPAALRSFEHGHTRGKVVITV